MATPFPGMDPYLEAPGLWPDFHDSFLTYARESLQPLLPPRYYAQLRTREEIGIAGFQGERVIHPDIAVKERGAEKKPPEATRPHAGRTSVPELLVIEAEDRLDVSFLEIREVNEDRLVTLIEMLSPSNKVPGEDRKRFAEKRREILASETSWIEIDLLRSGKRLDPRLEMHCRAKGHQYAVVVSRASRRRPLTLEVYGFRVRDAFPSIGVPLRDPDPDVPLDLGHVFRRTYETGPYRKVVRYDLPPDPELPPEDAAWIRDRSGTR